MELVASQARHDPMPSAPMPSDGAVAGPAPLGRPVPAARRRLSRRAVLRLTWAAATLPLLAACRPTLAPTATQAPSSEPPGPVGALSAPTAPPQTSSAATTKPARSGGGALRLLLWQAPTILNPHLAQGTKDYMAARCCTEPLITVDNDGTIVPVLAAEVPSIQNGGLSPDGKSVTYKLKQGITWADGQPFSADDVVFTQQFITEKTSSSVSAGSFTTIDRVEALDPAIVKITFKQPTGGWFVPFCGSSGQILPKHLLQGYLGEKSREAPLNSKLLGTGPWMVEDFKPGDLVVYRPNPRYREAGKPYFERLEIKGGGDAVSAARAVFQTGEFDFAWNLQVEWPVLQDVMKGGKGELVTAPGGGVEQIYFPFMDNTRETDGERGKAGTKHPFLSDLRVRQAMAMAIDRPALVSQLYGPTGAETANILTTPASLASKRTHLVFDLAAANALLDQAGYKRSGDGIRVTPSGARMKIVLQTATNSLRQKEQAIVKDGWQKIGIETELKSIDSGTFFASDPGNVDTYAHFSVDVEMFTGTFDLPFPVSYMNRWYTGADPSRTWAQKSNGWAGRNFTKWKNDRYDALFERVLVELDQDKATELWQLLNDLVIADVASIPLVDRKSASARAKHLTGPDLRAFDNETWNIADWKKA